MSKRRRDFRWMRWLIFLVLGVGAITVLILIKNKIFDENLNDGRDKSSNIVEQKSEPKEEKSTEQQTAPEKEKEKEKEKVSQYEGENPNTSESLTGLITYADVVNDALMIRVNIDQFLQSGNCNISISKNGATHYVDSVAILESVTTSTCDGFSIPVEKLPGGDLQVEISLQSENKSGKIVGKVRIQK